MQCLLCEKSIKKIIFSNKHRDFYHCFYCDLIFVPPQFHLKKNEEKKQYDFHQNNPQDHGYKNFLNKIITPLLNYLTPGMQGLDFGSGPGPTLHLLLEEAGYLMNIYDPFYANCLDKLKQPYDFITCTEVVEHFHTPNSTWQQVVKLVKRHGYLAVMTLLHDNVKDFSSWWYKNDLTHVAFYSKHTMRWIAERFNLELIYCDYNRVVLFQK